MLKRFHGIDKHKNYSTISVLGRDGKEIEFIGRCLNLKEYVSKLNSEDAVILEASTGSFHFADLIEQKGASCFVLNPYRFKIIKDSWNKTDKRDARNMVKALWVHLVTGEFGIPVVYKPELVIRELRRLFTQFNLYNKQITMLKNNLQTIIRDNGLKINTKDKSLLLSKKSGFLFCEKLKVSDASKIGIKTSLELLWNVLDMKQEIKEAIIITSEPLKEKVELLISIHGVSLISALAFLADVGDIKRFNTTRKMNSYLGLVPKVKDSGDKLKYGHINRASRKVARTVLTQSLIHFTKATTKIQNSYMDLVERRGTGRSRIAMVRKLCGIMRQMLLNNEKFRWINSSSYERKIKEYKKYFINEKEKENCS